MSCRSTTDAQIVRPYRSPIGVRPYIGLLVRLAEFKLHGGISQLLAGE